MGINHPFETPGAEPTVAAVSDAVRLDRIRYELDTVPSFDAFAPVDDLSDRLHDIARIDPDRCRIDSIGRSASGEEIERLTIDGGPRSAIVVGFPHPNEPVGGLTALHLARRLLDVPDLRDRHGLTWHIIACVDPDGARLNETWFSDPGSRDAYNAGFYRPPGRLQVEWTFPFAHGDIRIDAPIPETRALMGLIDEVEPDLLVSLHNSECGGVYSYLSRPEPRLYDVFAAIPGAVGLVLDVGEPEAPWIPLLAPGVFESRPMEEIVDGIIASGGRTDLLAGTSSTDYARRFDTLTLVCEVPQWIDDRACDEQPGTERYDELLATQATRYSQAVTELRSILDAAGDDVVDSPFLVAVVEFLDDMESIAEGSAARSEDSENARIATVAEEYSVVEAVDAYRGRLAGMLVRALSATIESGIATAEVTDACERAEKLRTAWLAESTDHSQERPAPIGALVAAQYGAILAAALLFRDDD